MAEPVLPIDAASLRRQLTEKSRLLSELDVMLADYQEERSRLILELRTLQSQLREAEEWPAQAEPQPSRGELQ